MAATNDDSDERALRAHIHEIMFDYAMEHLTTDYVQFTNDAVSELLAEALQIIPLYDKNALRLPIDPWDKMSDLYGLQNLPPYQEKLQIATEISQYLRIAIRAGGGPPKSERVARDCKVNDTFISSFTLPTSAVLSLKAQRETPCPGAGFFLSSLPKKHTLVPLASPPKSDEPCVSESHVLDIAWRLQAEDHQAVSSILKSAAVLSRPVQGYTNIYLNPVDRPQSPSFAIREEAFVPIFPRAQRHGAGGSSSVNFLPDLQSVFDLSHKIPSAVKIEDEEIDFAKANMSLVDGWQTICHISSPQSPSTPTSSQDDNIDQLLVISSPNSSLWESGIEKMDVPPIPRTRRIKGSRKPKTASDSLTAFMQSHLRPVMALPIACSSPEPSLSMVGHAPTTLESEDLAQDIRTVYGTLDSDDVKMIVMDDALDQCDRILIPVPDLPPPNKHPPNALFLPKGLADFIRPAQRSETVLFSHTFLRKTKGLKALNLTLPWTPFTTSERLPTHMEVTRSTMVLDNDDAIGAPVDHMESQIQTLLDTLIMDVGPATDYPNEVHRQIDAEHLTPTTFSYIGLELLLSRRELNGYLMDEAQDEDGNKENEPLPLLFDEADDSGIALDDGDKENMPPVAKRRRIGYDDDDDDSFRLLIPADNEEESVFWLPDDEVTDALASYPPHQNIDEYTDIDRMAFSCDDAARFESLPFEETQEAPFAYATRRYHPSPTPDTYIDPHILQPPPDATDCDDWITPQTAIEVEDLPQLNLANHALGISEFLRLRSRAIKDTQVAPQPIALPAPAPDLVPEVSRTSVYDKNTLRLPTHSSPSHPHLYLASMDLLQKNLLLAALRAPNCAVDFVEREDLSGVDMVLDVNTAIIFASLVSLPSQRASLVDIVSEQSWRYSSLLVIFEAYPASRSFKNPRNEEDSFNAYTPPTLKAIGRFRRDLDLSVACKKKSAACVVRLAFADTVHEAALLARHFGDVAEKLDPTLWGDRSWLDGEIPDEEDSLARVPGMNRFAAYVILCQVSVDEFLGMAPEGRVDAFSKFVGEERMVAVNTFIEERAQVIDSDGNTS